MAEEAPVVVDPAAAAAAAANPDPAAAAQSAAATPWTAGLEADLLGVAQTRGWYDKPADQVAREILKSYREAEKHIGVPPDQILRMPKQGDTEAEAAFWQRLGVPKDATGYDFSGVKFSDGTELDDGFVQTISKVAAEAHIPAEAAKRVVDGLVKYMENADSAGTADTTAQVQQEQAALTKEWGPNLEANRFIAKQAALAAGVTEAEFDALSKTPGGAKMLQVFRFFGSKMGEDKFITSAGGPGNGIMTYSQAVARVNELKADEAFRERYFKGDTAANREMSSLTAIIAAGNDEAA